MTVSAAIEQVVKSPQKRYTREEARQLLQKYGVLTKDGNVSKAYSHIVVKADNEKENGKK